jgi:PKD repeat protein
MRHLLSLLRKTLFTSVSLLIISLLDVTRVAAQTNRPTETFYLRAQVGIASYVGDHSKAFFSFDESFPYSAGVELGYQFGSPLSIGFGYEINNFPAINGSDDAGIRHSTDFLLRIRPGSPTRVAPYILAGGHATFGSATIFETGESKQKAALGPVLGVGLDVPVDERVSFFLEGKSRLAFPDEAADGREGDRSGSFDLLSSIGLGLKINFKGPGEAPEIQTVEGPTQLNVGETGAYRAYMLRAGSAPVEYRWEWGDGTVSTGLTASHSYTTPGAYTIRFVATNRQGTVFEPLFVTVVQPKQAPQITSLTASPTDPDTDDTVYFNAVVGGDGPFIYSWDFGDGSTASGASASHRYESAGSYVVTLTVSNEAGTDSRSLNVNVEAAESALCGRIADLSPVYFGRNSSVLTQEARRTLGENAQVLVECPELNVRLEGWAAPEERNPQDLSTDRARTVEEFYIGEGVARDRFEIIGMGRVADTTSKKDGTQLFQRVDSIIIR